MTAALDFLQAAQNPDGGWGYKRGGMSYVEPTAAVLLAVANETGAAAARARGRDYLRALQHADGGWGIAAVDDESGWMTAWAVWALQDDSEIASRGAEWLLRTEGLRVTDPAQVAAIRKVLEIDPTLRGWPWQVGDAAWIFPTGLALLALSACGYAGHPRLQEGIRFLLDRAIPSGGWNVGNPFMVTGELPATVVNTSLALISLGGFPISDERVTRAQTWLRQRLPQARSAAELAWGAWAARVSEIEIASSGVGLRSLEQPDGSWAGNPFTTAIALLGLA